MPPGHDLESRANALVATWRPVLLAHAREIPDLTALLEPEIGWYWQPLPLGGAAGSANTAGGAGGPDGAVDVVRIIRSDNQGIQLAARLTTPGPGMAARWVDRTGEPIDDIAAYLERYKPAPPPPPGLIQLQIGPPRGLPYVPPRPARGPALGVEPPRERKP